MTEQTKALIQSLPNFADDLRAADPRGSSEWEIVRWVGIDPGRVRADQIEVASGLSIDGQPVKNRFASRTEALRSSANWVRRNLRQYTERDHRGVWKWQEGDKILYQTVLPVSRHRQQNPHPTAADTSKNSMSSTIVRLSEEAYKTVRRLADEEGKSLLAILDEAVRELDRLKFFAKVNAAYKALRADPKAWQEELQERAMLDGTLLDDIDHEDSSHTDISAKHHPGKERRSA